MDTKQPVAGEFESLLGFSPHGTESASEAVMSRVQLPIGQIHANPHQPRKSFDDDEIAHLSNSIKNHGILQPLVVRPKDGHFQLIAGERRLRAAQAAGLSEVPVTVVNFNDQQVFEASLVENIQRADLNPIEKAQGFKEYIDSYNVSQEVLASRLGIDRTTVSNLVNLLNLPEEVQTAVRLSQITLGHAKILKGLSSVKRQVELCTEVVMKGLSVKALELLVRQQKAEAEAKAAAEALRDEAPSYKTAHVVSIETELRQRYATKVEIKVRDQNKGQILIGFDSSDEFERIIESLRK